MVEPASRRVSLEEPRPSSLDEAVVASIAARARGSPREALRLLREEGALAALDAPAGD